MNEEPVLNLYKMIRRFSHSRRRNTSKFDFEENQSSHYRSIQQ